MLRNSVINLNCQTICSILMANCCPFFTIAVWPSLKNISIWNEIIANEVTYIPETMQTSYASWTGNSF